MRRNLTSLLLSICFVLVLVSGVAMADMQKMWTQTYRQTDSYLDDIAYSMAIDQNDNIVITGKTVDDSADTDLLALKYDSEGQLQWSYTYDGHDSYIDIGYQITTDDNGDMYIVGVQTGPASEDGLVIKLSASGFSEWTSTYDGTDGLDDKYYLVRLDGSGNVVCGGYHERLIYGKNALVSIYDPNGNEIDGVAVNGSDNSEDFATDIAIDSTGAIYMSGSFTNTSSGQDIGLVKILPDGTQDWMEILTGFGVFMDFGGSIAFDHSENVFVAGTVYHSADNFDPVLMSVDSQGTSVLSYGFDGEEHNNERLPNVNSLFNPYITHGNNNMKIGSSGNLFIIGTDDGAGPADNDIILLKVSTSGSLIWRQQFDGPDADLDECWDFVVDSQENVYIAGAVTTAPLFKEAAIIQYDTDGNLIDVQYNSSSTSTAGQAYAVALDSNENPVIAGIIFEPTTDFDAFVTKYCIGCLIDDTCYPDGTVNPSNPDEICDVSQTQIAWSDNSGDDDDDDDDTSDDDDDDDDDDTADDDDDDDTSPPSSGDDDDDGGCCG